MDPIKLLKFKRMLSGFEARHPKFIRFMSVMRVKGFAAGTIIEVKVTTPAGEEYSANLKVQPEDVECLQQIHEALH